ncbi:MAG: MarR family transcriptional regulator [Bacteroidetes bacterium]|nr:MarR family transcriptional regulator [Bacteroidota bacterium]
MNEVLRFSEDLGVIMERAGIPRIAGKIFGLLLVSPEPYLAAEEISERIKASRASVSTMTRTLIQSGLVEKVGVTGERRNFFRIKSGATADLVRRRLALVSEFRRTFEDGLTLVKDHASPAGQRLRELVEFYTFFEREFPLLIDRFTSRSMKTRKRG